jgi:hypothetical protein
LAVAADWLPYWDADYPIERIVPWDETAYDQLRQVIEALPLGVERDQALIRIETVDCSDAALSCAPSFSTDLASPEAQWRKSLEDAGATEDVYDKALSKELKSLVCSGDAEAPYVLRGLIRQPGLIRTLPGPDARGRLAAVGREAPALVDFILSKDCPVSASLTDADKARLLQIKRDAIKEAGQ